MVTERAQGYLGLNQQLYDLGMSSKDIVDPAKVDLKISELDSVLDLVMIADRMDESLVLMSDLLCLPLSEVATLRTNARKSASKVSCSWVGKGSCFHLSAVYLGD